MAVLKKTNGFIIMSGEFEYQLSNTLNVFSPQNSTLKDFINGRSISLIVDEFVLDKHGSAIRTYIHEMDIALTSIQVHSGREVDKTPEEALRLAASSLGSRDCVIIGVGGGVVLDIAGFVAATFRRGVPYMRVATTMIGAVDVCCGVKQGVNLTGRKNLLGSYYAPEVSVADRSFLKTQSLPGIRAGMAEVIKVALIGDARLFQLLELHGELLTKTKLQMPEGVADDVIYRSQNVMLQELDGNLKEKVRRRSVDLGHTFSPRIEASSAWRISHGLAVAEDMALSTAIGVELGVTSADTFERLISLYHCLGLRVWSSSCTISELMDAMVDAQSHRGQLNLVVPAEVGRIQFLQSVSPKVMSRAVNVLCEIEQGMQACAARVGISR